MDDKVDERTLFGKTNDLENSYIEKKVVSLGEAKNNKKKNKKLASTDHYIELSCIKYGGATIKYILNKDILTADLKYINLDEENINDKSIVLAMTLLECTEDYLFLNSENKEEENYDEEEKSIKTHNISHAFFYKPIDIVYEGNYIKNSAYLMNLVAPIRVCDSHIILVSVNGSNYYYSENNPAINIMFGNTEIYKAINEVYNDEAYKNLNVVNCDDYNLKIMNEIRNSKLYSAYNNNCLSSYCDVWASFLSLTLGTIQVHSDADKILIADLFNAYLENFKLSKPIEFKARNIYIDTDTDTNKVRVSVKFSFSTEQDKYLFFKLRRVMKKFLLLIKSIGHCTPSTKPALLSLNKLLDDNYEITFQTVYYSYNISTTKNRVVRGFEIINNEFIEYAEADDDTIFDHNIRKYSEIINDNHNITKLDCNISIGEIRLQQKTKRSFDLLCNSLIMCRAYVFDRTLRACTYLFAKNSYIPRLLYAFTKENRANTINKYVKIFMQSRNNKQNKSLVLQNVFTYKNKKVNLHDSNNESKQNNISLSSKLKPNTTSNHIDISNLDNFSDNSSDLDLKLLDINNYEINKTIFDMFTNEMEKCENCVDIVNLPEISIK